MPQLKSDCLQNEQIPELLFHKETIYENNNDISEEIYFISDLHLSASTPALLENFKKFIEIEQLTTKKHNVKLYILGDLFDFWIGDRGYKKLGYQEDINVLKNLSNKGVDVFVMHGNRDFLLGYYFSWLTKTTLIKEPTILNINNKTLLLMHGDGLCSDDINHQKFRRISRRYFPFIVPFLPIKIRLKLAQKIRQESIKNSSRKSVEIMDISDKCLTDVLSNYQPDIFIHGHTHRPQIHIENNNGKEIKRIVLSDW